METVYQSVALDEEQQTSDKETLLWRVERRIFPQHVFSKDNKILQSSIWLCHGVLLSVSLALFALSYCMRYGKLSDASCASQLSPYCKLPSRAVGSSPP